MKKDIFTNSKNFWNTAQRFIHHYLPDIRKVSRHTVSSYKDGLNAYIGYLEEEKGIRRKNICFNHLSEDSLKEYQDWLLNVKKRAAKTCNLRLTSLRSFLEYAAGEHHELTALYVSACDIRESKIPVKPIEFFEKAQMKAILAAPDSRTRTGRRNQMMMVLMYDSAARVSELLELELGNVHLRADIPYVTLHGKGDKYRNVPLMQKTCRHLKRYMDEFHEGSEADAPLFYAVAHGKKHHLSSDTMEKLVKKCAAKAQSLGIEMPDSCHCHMVRKTRAMDLYQSGVPLTHIQQLLGHEDISTTSGFYAFATLETLAKAMAKTDNSDETVEKNWKDSKVMEKLYSL
ncbi:MAG: tyrosine-type recombinase/integrase [Lachnospiraceae bacterium]|nr:tyrosine-type recombinase/integrase [Lachnospiraceae bacterium]